MLNLISGLGRCRRSSFTAIVALVLLCSACGSGAPDDALNLPETTPDSTVDDNAEPTATSDDESTPSSSDPGSTTAEAEGDSESQSSSGAATVSLDPGDLEEPIDVEKLNSKLEQAVVAATENWTNCLIVADTCDFENDVAPSVSGDYERYLSGLLALANENGQRLKAPVDLVGEPVETSANTNPPFIADVRVCTVDNGVMYIPASDGNDEEITDDRVLSLLYSYIVVQEDDGLLTVTSRAVLEQEEGDQLCGEYS